VIGKAMGIVALLGALSIPCTGHSQSSYGLIVWPTVTLPSTLGASQTVTTSLQPSNGYSRITASVMATQSTTICIERFADAGGTLNLDGPTRNCNSVTVTSGNGIVCQRRYLASCSDHLS
jgi:hypothetical protein